MNFMLIVREEIICLCILIFILLCSRFYEMGKDQGYFLRICFFAIGHVAFDLITVLTVNSTTVVPELFNKICHIIFYLFALLFSHEFFCYIISRCYKKETVKKIRTVGLIPLVLYLLAVPFLRMDYIHGSGTNYSFGPSAFVGYGVAMLFFVLSIIIVIINIKKLDKNVASALLPMLCTAIIVEMIQIIVPELLFTGGAVTLITVGFFFSLENPVIVLRQKVLTDALTGVKSRHSYEADIIKMDRNLISGTVYGMVFVDINGLKAVNDTMGHLVGDEYIGCIAEILMKYLKNSENIYRMGGDEFLAVYRNKDKEHIMSEIAAVRAECKEQSRQQAHQVSVSIGFAMSDSSVKAIKDVLHTADFRMYSEKARIKQRNIFMLDNTDDINISGLTDRVFDVLSVAEASRFLFVTNISTNVTRWSVSAVDYLGLPSIFIYDCSNVLVQSIHPNDRNSFIEDTTEIISGKRTFSESEYRIKNAVGEYVTCVCSGTFLCGKNGEPDLYAGTMRIQEASEGIDALTGLRNGREMTNYFRELIKNNIPAAVMQLGIVNLGRINMLYGYISGNEILKQFASVIRLTVGKKGDIFCFDSNKFVVSVPNEKKEILPILYKEIHHAAEQQIYLDIITPPLKLAAGAAILPKTFLGTASFLQSNLIFAYDRSKYNEHGNLFFYDGASDTLLSGERKNRLLSIHKDAIGNREGFYVTYQPIVRFDDKKIVSAEALIRWKDDNFGEVSPEKFIPWLEGDPCFFNLGSWILKQSLTEAKPLLKSIPNFVLNVNIAIQQLEREEFGDTVLKILEETDFPASQLCLELTERCRELNPEFLKSRVDFFRSHGIKIALDDFGTGFSSFGLLLELEVDTIKLDREFIKKIKTNKFSRVLTKMLIDVSNNFGYSTCLEGVENDDLCKYLEDCGATYFQGFYCSSPVTIDEFHDLIRQWNDSVHTLPFTTQ